MLISDGEDQGGDDDAVSGAATIAQNSGVHIETVGVGTADGATVAVDGRQDARRRLAPDTPQLVGELGLIGVRHQYHFGQQPRDEGLELLPPRDRTAAFSEVTRSSATGSSAIAPRSSALSTPGITTWAAGPTPPVRLCDT